MSSALDRWRLIPAGFAMRSRTWPRTAEAQGFFGGHAFPILGTTSCGENARFGGGLEGSHNATAVMATW